MLHYSIILYTATKNISWHLYMLSEDAVEEENYNIILLGGLETL